MKRKKIIAIAMMFCLCLGASLFTKTKSIWRKNEFNYVKLGKANKELGKLDHPAEISPEQMRQILKSLKYSRSWLNITGEIGKKTTKQYDLFLPEEIEELGTYLSQALQAADSGQWVDFSLQAVRNKLSFIGSERISDGLVFVKEGKLNFVMRDVGEPVGAEERVVTTDPFKYYSGSSAFIPGPGQELAKNKKGKTMKNWLLIDLAELCPKVAPELEAGETGTARPEAKPGATIVPKPGAAKSPKERLSELRELYDKGLITEEEYNRKRKEILDQL
jgi:hypothetical protein